MATKSSAKRLEELLERYGPRIAKEFLRAVDDLRAQVDLRRFIDAIEARDYFAAVDALNLDPSAYNSMLDEIEQAFREGGGAEAERMAGLRGESGARVVIRFNARNPQAESWLREHSSKLVTRIVDDQREAVRTALSTGMERGANPRTVALDIVGRIDRTTGARTGGILGLTTGQERAIQTAREELTSGDPALLKNYLNRALRDKRFDRTIKKAIRDGEPVPPETIGRALAQLKNRTLKYRGDLIGRVEAMTSLQYAKHQAYEQAIADGKVAEDAIIKTWRSAGDMRVRHTHAVLDGNKAKFREGFISPSGARMLYPMDTSMGAGMDEIANCRCDCTYEVDFLAGIR